MSQEITRIDLQGVNCYLGKAGDGFVLFDTGGHMATDKQFTSRRENLAAELEKAGCRPGNLKLVVLTHGDNDHAANAAYIKEKYGAKIAMHPGDLELVNNPQLEKVMESFRFRSVVYKAAFLLMRTQIAKSTLKILEDFDSFTPDILHDEGHDLSEFGWDATVLHIPGHTPGSVCILTAEGDLIAGDTLANTGKPDIALNAVDFKTMAASVKRLRGWKLRTVYPGHGEPFDTAQAGMGSQRK